MMFMLMAIQLYSVFIIRLDRDDPIYMFFFWTKVIIFSVYLLFVIVVSRSMLQKLFTASISPELLTVRSKELKASDIKEIRVQGYFKPIIGIVPMGKRINPPDLCFRFIEQEDTAIKALTDWAKSHNIKIVTNKNVRRW